LRSVRARCSLSAVVQENGDAGMKGSFAGIVLIVLGLLFLAQNFGLLELKPYWKFWPAILIVIGLYMMIGRRR
jgi:uncharacterized integral membrane protein